jgi:hypothetical protein
MTAPTFDLVTLQKSTALATNDTIVFTYPNSRVGAAYAQSGEHMEIPDLGNSLDQASDTFTIAYGTSTTATLTYKDATTVPAFDEIVLQLPLAEYNTITALTDNSGGTASNTLADVPGTYTEATLANQIASLAAKINELVARANKVETLMNDQNMIP